MKNLLYFIPILFLSMFLQGQTIVSTKTQKKNAVLEEYTYPTCPYCAGGHKIAIDMKKELGDKLSIVTIHTSGSYSITYGTDFATFFNVVNAPTATINRHFFELAGASVFSKGDWDGCVKSVIKDNSIANIAVNANLNYATRELTILVEVYYTANSNTNENFLNLVLLQNWIKGYQANQETNPEYVTNDGNYYHMHTFRNLITPKWGDTIKTTAQGSFFTKTYNYTIPNAIGGINVDLSNLELVAFVAESKKEIINSVDVLLPQIAEITDVVGFPNSYCSNLYTPILTVKNNSASNITSFEVNYEINGISKTQSWNGTIASGATTQITLPAENIVTSGNQSFKAEINKINGAVKEHANLKVFSKTFATFDGVINASYNQDFTSISFPPSTIGLDASVESRADWIRSGYGHSPTGSAMLNWFYANKLDTNDLIIQPIKISGINQPELAFYVAHRQRDASNNDRLLVDVSIDCGASWTNVFDKRGSDLSTGNPVKVEWKTPSSTEWRRESVDISEYNNKDVMIRFRGISDNGNNVFIDDIFVGEMISGINDNIIAEKVQVFPNPADKIVNISFKATESSKANVEVYNYLGKLVLNQIYYSNAGNNVLQLNTYNLNEGLYLVNIKLDSEDISTEFVVER